MANANAVDICKAVAKQLNETPWEWPDPSNGDNDPVSDVLLTDYTTAKAYVIPQISRVKLIELRIFVSPPPETRQTSDDVDRCGRNWVYLIEVLVGQTIRLHDNEDEFQPLELEKISQMMKMTDSVTDFLDQNRSIANVGKKSQIASLTALSQISYDRDQLTESGIFAGVVQATYRVR